MYGWHIADVAHTLRREYSVTYKATGQCEKGFYTQGRTECDRIVEAVELKLALRLRLSCDHTSLLVKISVISPMNYSTITHHQRLSSLTIKLDNIGSVPRAVAAASFAFAASRAGTSQVKLESEVYIQDIYNSERR